MTRATPLQIEAACRTRSADAATAYLRDKGLEVRRSQCATMISRLIARKERKAMANPISSFSNMGGVDISAFDAEMGSKRLLAAHLTARQHFIHEPARFAAACREAGL